MKTKFVYISISLVFGAILGVVCSCAYFTPKIATEDKGYSINHIDSLQDKVMNGDTSAYNELRARLFDSSEDALLYWAFITANKYHYSKAYEDVYNSIHDSFNSDSAIFQMDPETRKFALKYLDLAIQKKDTSAIYTLNDLKKMNAPDVR